MATVPSGTRFIGIAPSVDLKERKSAVLNKMTEPFTIDDIRGYKVFTALLTQNGGDNVRLTASDDPQPFLVGVTYVIADNTGNADFTNIGAPNNNVGTYFIATGTTPATWGDGSYVECDYNEGAPVVTVLENTIGNVWFDYTDVGTYNINSDGLLSIDKRQFYYGLLKSLDNANGSIIESDSIAYNNNFIQIITLDNGGNAVNGMYNTPFASKCLDIKFVTSD